MRWYLHGSGTLLACFTMVAVVACQQESPVEQAGKEVTEHAQGAIDKAKGVGDTVEDAAQNTAEEVEKASE